MSWRTTRRDRPTRGIHGLLGCVLLSAAGLKLYGRNVSPFAQYGWFSTPEVQLAAVAWEAVLGAWLLSRSHRTGAWMAVVVTFAAFAGVSAYLGVIGQASCGCFGAIKASPWHALAVDVGALGLLAAAWPGSETSRAVSRADVSPLRSGPVSIAF